MIHDWSRNTVRIMKQPSFSVRSNSVRAPACPIRSRLSWVSPSRQSVKSSPCSVQVIRYSSQKASAMVFGIRGSLPAGSFPAGSFPAGSFPAGGLRLWLDPDCLQAWNAACPLDSVCGQEIDHPDAALGFDREPVICGFLPEVFQVFLEHLLFRSLADIWGWPSSQNARGWLRGGLYGPWERFDATIYPDG